MSEEENWDSFRDGDIKSFEKLYDSYSKELYKYARNFSDELYLIEDCIQELFTTLWESRSRLSPTTSVRFYLLRSMRRLLFRRLSQMNKRNKYELEDPHGVFESVISPESFYILSEDEKRIQDELLNAVNSLPVRQREVMYLRYYQDLSFDEIAELTGISKKTAYNMIFIALNTLKRTMKNPIHFLFVGIQYL